MNILIDNQPTIFVDILCNYLYSNKHFVRFYSSCKYFNNLVNDIDLKRLFFKPKNSEELIKALELYSTDKKKCYSTYGHIISWDTKCITNLLEVFASLCQKKDIIKLTISEVINDWNFSNMSLLDYQLYSHVFAYYNIKLPVNYNNYINDYMGESNFGDSSFSYL